MDSFDLTISQTQDWNGLLEKNVNVIVDPAIYRIGQIFLEGRLDDSDYSNAQWQAVANDVAGLANFFDLIVLHDRLPAFNYAATFDFNFHGRNKLSELVNQQQQIILDVDVKLGAYMEAKQGALEQLAKRASSGRLISDVATRDILTALTEIEYRWEPDLQGLEDELRKDQDQVRVARFLLGVLLFGGYAQQSGAPHTLSPRRSKLIAEAGLRIKESSQTAEDELYDELGRRFRDAGEGWRDEELPWTPTFLPFMLERLDDPYRQGPDTLLKEAVKLRNSEAIQEYRKLRADVLAPDNSEKQQEARRKLKEAAGRVSQHLGTDWQALGRTRHFLVGVFPKAIGAAAGGALGAALGGPIGAPIGAGVGGLAGVVGEEALKPVHARLWGWVIDRLPYRSASKLLTRSILDDYKKRKDLAKTLHTVWKTGFTKI
jgi:hypothetical protein